MKTYISLYYKSLMAIMAILLPVIIAFTIIFNNKKKHIKAHAIRDLIVIAEAYEGLVFQFTQLAKQRDEDFASDGFIRGAMERSTVAEFVETRESLDLLREWGIDYAQGYLIGKPDPEPDF